MIEEVIFLTEAEKLNIVVSDDDVKKVVEDIKSDYPDDEFERTMLENAVSYDTWEQRMKMRLIMEKLVKTQLEDQIIITKEDVLKYYKENNPDRPLAYESKDQRDSVNEMIVKRLKRQKAQEAYTPWIKNLKDRYRDKIKINEDKFKDISEEDKDIVKIKKTHFDTAINSVIKSSKRSEKAYQKLEGALSKDLYM